MPGAPNTNTQANLMAESRAREEIHASIRLIIYITIPLLFILSGSMFVKTDPPLIAQLDANQPVLAWILRVLNYCRFAVIPVVTIEFVLYAAGKFVEEIYGLKTPGLGLRFVRNAMFGSIFPDIRIRRSKITAPPDNIQLLERIGGPISLMIQADTAVLLQRTRMPSNTATNQGYFLAPFERIDKIVSLEDQEGYSTEINTVTRDGIQVRLTDVRYRYRILPGDQDGGQHVRSIQRPYSFSDNALREIAYNASATGPGPDKEDSWAAMVSRMVVGHVIDFINLHTVDFLTAPQRDGRAPRAEINRDLNSMVQNQLKGAGAQLLWIDVGHIDIIDPNVDQDRLTLWAADWAGNAHARRDFADAARSAFRELGRAEAQAQMIMGITRALHDANLAALPREQVSAMLLMRTAQILEGFRQDGQQKEP